MAHPLQSRRTMRVGALLLSLSTLPVLGCAAPEEPDPGAEPQPDPDPDPPPGSDSPRTIEAVVDHLEPGWLVTTTRLRDTGEPVETTLVSDGTPITLTGSATDVFVATVTDGDGQLAAFYSMGAGCKLDDSRVLRVPRDYPTIQAAIDAAVAGDTVRVAPGVYTESVTMKRNVCLIGSGAKQTILDAEGEPRNLVDLTSAPGSLVAGFTMRGVTHPSGGCATDDPFDCSGNWYRAAIYLGGTHWNDPTQDAPPLIISNELESNDFGVLLYWRGVAVVRNNVFFGNRNGMVANHFQSRTLVANNVFFANEELAIGNQAAYLDIINNVISRSELGIRFQYIQTGHIRYNAFRDNVRNSNEPRFTIGMDGNVETDPLFLDADAGDFRLGAGSPAIDAGSDPIRAFEPDGTRNDIGAFGGPLAVWTPAGS